MKKYIVWNICFIRLVLNVCSLSVALNENGKLLNRNLLIWNDMVEAIQWMKSLLQILIMQAVAMKALSRQANCDE